MADSDDVVDYRLQQVERDIRALGPTAGEVMILSVRVEGLIKSLEQLDEREQRHHEEQMTAIDAGKLTFIKSLAYSTPIIVALITTLLAK